MDPATTDYPKWDYEHYPRHLPRDDFWGQVRRTVHGRRLTELEIGPIVQQLRDGLLLTSTDSLLEVACGNGALSARLFDECSSYLGTDYSEYLIGVAREFFERQPTHVFAHGDAITSLENVRNPHRFTKALCCSFIQYLPELRVADLLATLHRRFPNVDRVLIANVPDRSRADRFFGSGHDEKLLAEHQSQIGRWWSPQEITALSRDCNWLPEVKPIDSRVFNSKYRFDVVLTRRLPD